MNIRPSVYALATIVQFLIGTFIFGTGYALVLFIVRYPASPVACGIIGLIHGLAVGLSLPLIARYDPAMRSGRTRNPGLLALNYGVFSAFGLVAVHVVYGVIFGLAYAGGRTFHLTNAWLAGLIATAVMTVLIMAGKALKIAPISTIDIIASSLQEVTDRR